MNDAYDAPDYAHPLQDHESRGWLARRPQGGNLKPSIGRIVHYYDEDAKIEAAIIVDVAERTVCLTVFGRDGADRFEPHVAQRSELKPTFCWDWPERVS